MTSPQNELLILVGLTGTGKTTTVNALREVGLNFHLLPNRRTITDEFIIGYLQKLDGDPVEQIKDRTERFAYTRRYRKMFPGGMAHALREWLMVNGQLLMVNDAPSPQPPIPSPQSLIFDGLRGENEITHAVELFPEARFLFLHAPDFVRMQRLVQRRDVFDAVTVDGEVDTAVLHELAQGILTNEERDHLLTQIANGEIDAQELQAKLTIVRTERQNYDPDTTLAALQNLAPDRLIFGDTVACSPEEIAMQVKSVMRDS